MIGSGAALSGGADRPRVGLLRFAHPASLLALVAVAVSIGVVAYEWFKPTYRHLMQAGRFTALGAIALGAAFALLAAAAPPRAALLRRAWLFRGVAALSTAALAGAIWAFGHRHLGGFDHSALIDVAWRIASGQRPGIDFPSTTPIGFALAAGHALRWFGVTWSSLIGLQVLFASVTFLWLLWLLRRTGTGPWESLALALAVEASANVVTSYWWYNPATTTAGTLFFVSAAAFWREPRARAVLASYVASLLLLASMKPNVAGALIAGVTLVLLSSRAHRLRAIAVSAAALALFVAWLALERSSLPIVLRGYLSVSARGFTLAQFLQDLTPSELYAAVALLVACLTPWLFRLRAWSPEGHARWLAVAAMAAGLLGFVTNGEHKLVDLPLLLLALWWHGRCDGDSPDGRGAASGVVRAWRPWLLALAGTLIAAGIGVGALRDRVSAIGPGIFFEPQVDPTPLGSPFFDGFRGGPNLVEVEREVATALSVLRPRRPFFGPRMQWGYAAFGFEPPRNQPPWWHPGVTYPAGSAEEDAYVQCWIEARHDALIFLRGDYTYLPSRFLQEAGRRYVELPGLPWIQILVPAADRP